MKIAVSADDNLGLSVDSLGCAFSSPGSVGDTGLERPEESPINRAVSPQGGTESGTLTPETAEEFARTLAALPADRLAAVLAAGQGGWGLEAHLRPTRPAGAFLAGLAGGRIPGAPGLIPRRRSIRRG